MIVPGGYSVYLLTSLANLSEWNLFRTELAILLVVAATMLYLTYTDRERIAEKAPIGRSAYRYPRPAQMAVGTIYMLHIWDVNLLLIQLKYK